MELKNIDFYHLINHGPCVLITSGNSNKYNVATIAWITPVNDDPPIVAAAISEESYTTELIMKFKEFVINIVSQDHLKALKICGTTSGRKQDKFKKAKISPAPSKVVKTPHVKEAIGRIECKLKEYHKYNGVVLFVADVVHAEVNPEFYDGYLITHKAKTPHHVGGGYFMISSNRIK